MILPSWREGATRDALVRFMDAAGGVPPERRVAVFDNDGTLWCEKPNYPQLDFFVSELRKAAADRPELAERGEYRAVLAGDRKAISEFGLERDALAKASEAALAHTGGGTVTETEVGDEESYYEVEVTLADGSEVDVQLDENFNVVGDEVEGADEGDEADGDEVEDENEGESENESAGNDS